MATDYNKWNKFASELSDNEDEEETSTKPRVTTFDGDKGRSFMIGPSGAQLMPQPPPASSSVRKAPIVVESSSISVTKFELSSRNGGKTDRCTWSQDRNEVIVRKEFLVPVKASDIHVSFDHVESILTITVQKEPFLQGTMRYKFELNDDEMCPILWEVVTMTEPNGIVHRVFEMTLKKISPIPGAVIWWKNVFVDDPEIDVTTIPDRAASSSTTGKEIAGAWDDAHRMFLERIATREPITIDVDDDDDDDDGDNEEEEEEEDDDEAGQTGNDTSGPLTAAAMGNEEEVIETVEMEDEDGYCLIDRQTTLSSSPSSPTKGY